MKWLAFLLGFFSVQVFSQETNETRELIGHLGVTFLKEGCAAMCGSQGYLEPLLVDRRGNCQLLRPQAR